MSVEITIYFAWVPPNTLWSSSLARFDENIFDLVIEHDEGQIPKATIEVKNPRIGLINPSRNYWVWMSYEVGGNAPLPLFNGRLLGIPTEIIANTVKMEFIARDSDYIQQKQLIAESLKTLPFYDPIFFDVTKRDDPDAILEGWSALYHVDRITGRVSASEILIGEDGTVNFAPADVFYDSVQMKLLQSPLKAVNVKAEVQWEQQFRDFFFMGAWAFPTLGSDGFVADWPKSGSSLGGGWFAGVSWAGERDPDIATAMLATAQDKILPIHYKYVNKAKHHEFGDTMSVTINWQPPPPHHTAVPIRQTQVIGEQNPYNVDMNGDPDPINRPASVSSDFFTYRRFALDFLGKQSLATLGLVYDANRKRTERLDMTIAADVQPILIDPLITEDTEQITLKSGDLSLPIIDMLNWSSIAGHAVGLGQVIFPDNPLVPGQTSSQICVQAGTAGTVEPVFSNIAGQVTVDNTVHWSSMGATPPAESALDWNRDMPVSLGTILFPKPIAGAADINTIDMAGRLNYPPTGVALAKYTVLTHGYGGPGALMSEVTAAGIYGRLSGAPASLRTFVNSQGKNLFICVQAGLTGDFHPTWNETAGGRTNDGTAVWQNIGQAQLPIGGWGGMTPARTYFQQDRGKLSVEHGICRARAKLRRRARAVQVSFDTRFEVAAMLNCRMNGIVSDVRLPGSSISGKVISYKIEAHGSSGELKGSVVLGCSIGNEALSGITIFTEVGTPTYVTAGYCTDYQLYQTHLSGAPSGTPPTRGVGFGIPPKPPNWYTRPPTVPPGGYPTGSSTWSAGPSPPAGEEIGYTPPAGTPNDDGISFPATPGSLMLVPGVWHGIPSTLNPNNLAAYNSLIDTVIADALIAARQQEVVSPGGIIPGVNWVDIQNAVTQAVLKSVMQGEGLWYELVLKPLTNGPFENAYVIGSTPLLIPQTLNLSAPSSGF